MATSGVGSSSFTGNSSFSTQLQAVIQNAVSSASAPITQLQDQQATLSGQQGELNTLLSNFNALQNALTSLSSATGLGAYSASFSNTAVGTAQLTSGVLAGTYSLDVTSVGTQTNTISKDGFPVVQDPSSKSIDSASSYTLTVNTQTYTIGSGGGSLDALAQAINGSGAPVQATVVNVGSSSSPDYRLSVQSQNYAPDAIQLNDGTSNLLSNLSTGTSVTYQVNGQPATPITSSSRNLTLSPGLAVQVLATGSTSIKVGQNTTGVSSALSSFAAAYNAVVNELDKNRGQNGGALSGQSTIYELQNELSHLATYSSGSGPVTSLADLGLTFDQNGNLQFNAGTFASASASSTSQILSFLGSDTSGFLQAANSLVTAVTDPVTGIVPQANNNLTTELNALASKISQDQSNVSQLQQTLTTEMAGVDATISSLEQQVNEVSTLFSDMQQNSRNYNG